MTARGSSLFAVCAPGLEAVTEAELQSLGLRGSPEAGGVAFEGDETDLSRANLELRTATRVLLRLGEFRARGFGELERRAGRLPWARVLNEGDAFRLRVSCRKSKLYHEGAVAERLEAVVGRESGAGRAPDPGTGAADVQLIIVRFLRDVCSISADTSGPPLYMRGYRQALAKAPLRETIAAAMLLASGWTAESPLLDPLCGSGTIPLEAALLARRIPPGLATAGYRPRPFRFQRWPHFNAAAFEGTVRRLRQSIRAAAAAGIHGSDRNAGAIRAATANAERAGVGDDIEFSVRPLSGVAAPATAGWLVTNTPYGVRVGNRSTSRALGEELARLAANSLPAWTIVALTADREIEHALGNGSVLLRTRNGGIPVRMLFCPPRSGTVRMD